MAERKISWFVVTALDEIACTYCHTAHFVCVCVRVRACVCVCVCVCFFLSGQITTWHSFPLLFLINLHVRALVSDVENDGHDCMRNKMFFSYLGK